MSAYLPHRAQVRTLMALVDVGALALAARLAFEVRFQGAVLESKLRLLNNHPGLIVFALGAAVALAAAAELYEPEILYRRRETLVRVFVMASFWAGAVALATYVVPRWDVGRGVLALTVLFWTVATLVLRFFVTGWIRSRRQRFEALVLGEPAAVMAFCRALDRKISSPWKAVDCSHLGADDIAAEVDRRGAALVVLASHERGRRDRESMEHDLAHLHFSGVPIVAASELWAWLEERLPLEALSPAVFLHQPGFGAIHWTLFNRATRIADVVLALLMLVTSAPILLVAAVVVAVADGLPVLYRQTRLGQFGRHFVMYKLRTMVHDAEKHGPVFAQESDPRTIPGGALLRRLRIDELPQLWNVLRGEMSLVGPRPERPEMATALAEEIPYYSFRMAVPPGITGWAQVNIPYARDLSDHRRKLEFDLYFIRERSPRLYMLTLLRTLNAALVGARLPDQAHAEPATASAPSRAHSDQKPLNASQSAGSPRNEMPTRPAHGDRATSSGRLAPSSEPAPDPSGTR